MDLGSAEGGLDAVEDICKCSFEGCKSIKPQWHWNLAPDHQGCRKDVAGLSALDSRLEGTKDVLSE